MPLLQGTDGSCHIPVFKHGGIVRVGRLDEAKDALAVVFELLSATLNVSVVGISKAEKTWTLLRLTDPQAQREHGLDPNRFLFCYLNLADLQPSDQQEFFELMLSGMIRQARRRSALVCLHAPQPRRNVAFSQMLSYSAQAGMIGVNLVWALDEFDTAFRAPKLDLNVVSALRALASRPHVALVTATRFGLDRMCDARRRVGSSLAGLFVTVRLDGPSVDAGSSFPPDHY